MIGEDMNVIICRGGNPNTESIKSNIKTLKGLNTALAIAAARSNLSVELLKEVRPFLAGSTIPPIFTVDRIMDNIPLEEIAKCGNNSYDLLTSMLFNEFHKVAMEVGIVNGRETIEHLNPLRSKLLPIAGNVIDILKTKTDW